MPSQQRNSWQDGAIYILTFAGILWAVEIINAALSHRLNVFGIYPRELIGLWGLLLWPFLHGSIQHLAVNTTPFVVLGWFIAMRGPAIFLQTTITYVTTCDGGRRSELAAYILNKAGFDSCILKPEPNKSPSERLPSTDTG